MSNKFTLEDIIATAEREYAHCDIIDGENTVRLLNVLRLPKAARDAVTALQKELSGEDDEDDADQVDVFQKLIRTVAEDSEKVEALLEKVGDDLAVLVTIFNKYTAETEAGEA